MFYIYILKKKIIHIYLDIIKIYVITKKKKRKKKQTKLVSYKLHDLPVIKKKYINHLANERDIFNEVNI